MRLIPYPLQHLLRSSCLLCAGDAGMAPVCAACEADFPPLPASCPRCALPSPAGAACGACLAHPPSFEATIALWRYAFPVDRMIGAFKYHSRLALAAFFAARLASRVAALGALGSARFVLPACAGHPLPIAGPDMLVPMPLHPQRLAERGFNQALEIARVAAVMTGIALKAHAAHRTRSTQAQTELAWAERKQNLRGAFVCDTVVSGRSVALLDDVMTTGATLEELAKALKRAGAVRVENWVIARTLPD